jgi:hypothetical protein
MHVCVCMCMHTHAYTHNSSNSNRRFRSFKLSQHNHNPPPLTTTATTTWFTDDLSLHIRTQQEVISLLFWHVTQHGLAVTDVTVMNCQSTLRNIPEESRPHLHSSGSLKSHNGKLHAAACNTNQNTCHYNKVVRISVLHSLSPVSPGNLIYSSPNSPLLHWNIALPHLTLVCSAADLCSRVLLLSK